QHVGVDVDGDGEGQPDRHAGGEVLQLLLDELLELGEVDDLFDSLCRLAAAQPQQAGAGEDVVATGYLGVKSNAELDERRQAPLHRDLALVGPVDARDAPQKGALAAAV